jgi:DNA-binding response OmpR family regulator
MSATSPPSSSQPEPPAQATRVVRFGVFEVDLRTAELRKQGVRIRLPGQSFQVLEALLLRPGELVTREGVLLHSGFSIMRSEELICVKHLHEFDPSDDASGVVERFHAKHGL